MATMGSWGFLVIGCILVLLLLGFVARTILRDRGVRLATIASQRRGHMADCAACAGEGDIALLWDDRAGTTTWQPAVRHGRMVSGATRTNTRSCDACGGLGHFWVDD